MFNWLDYDGSSTQRTGPTIVGSWPTWWQIAPDCTYEVCCAEPLSLRGGRRGSSGCRAAGGSRRVHASGKEGGLTEQLNTLRRLLATRFRPIPSAE